MFGHLLRYFSFCKKDLLVFHPESDYSDNLRKALRDPLIISPKRNHV